MKARKVSITLEVVTALPLKILKDKGWWELGMIDATEDPELNVDQVQVNVIKAGK